MAVNRGKAFEDVVKRDFSKVSNCTVDRIHDQTNGFAGSSNICDFIIYRKPNIIFLECKSCYGNTLNFSNITINQWNGLRNKALSEGVIAGVMIWFIDKDETVFVPIQILDELKGEDNKSFNLKRDIDLEGVIRIQGVKKKVFFTYDMEQFLDEVQNGKC